MLQFERDGVAGQILHLHLAPADFAHLPVVDIHDIAGIFHDGGYVGTDKGFILAHTDDQRAAMARGHHQVGMVFAYNADGICAFDILKRALDGLEQVAFIILAHQVRNRFRIRLTAEGDAFLFQPGAQFLVVLDDAVVHHRDFLGHVKVGMGVYFARHPVGCPAGMADAQAARKRMFRQFLIHDFKLAQALDALEALLIDNGHAGRVVTAVFQAMQPGHNDFHGTPVPDVSYDSAHDDVPLLLLCVCSD
ncbi:MAG: hypothetical protein BWX80_03981 [Candidatus Hydrogenedentes bacterium ADurb.Bin101]|nr:MAG: hypothetical protein BWX80_03981 [Candidatus Hydrogenedentes bacterium ADurb.Bin101]